MKQGTSKRNGQSPRLAFCLAAMTVSACVGPVPTPPAAPPAPSPASLMLDAPAADIFQRTLHERTVETARRRLAASYPEMNVRIPSRAETPDGPTMRVWFERHFKSQWIADMLEDESHRHDAFGIALTKGGGLGLHCLVIAAPPNATAADILGVISGDRRHAPRFRSENRLYLDHQAIWHEIGDCLQIQIYGSNDSGHYTQTIADGLGIAMHLIDFGADTDFPERFAAYRRLSFLNKIMPEGRFGYKNSGFIYDNADFTLTLAREIRADLPRFRNLKLDQIFAYVTSRARDLRRTPQQERLLRGIESGIAAELRKYGDQSFGQLPLKTRIAILHETRTTSAEAATRLSAYISLTLSMMPDPRNPDLRLTSLELK